MSEGLKDQNLRPSGLKVVALFVGIIVGLVTIAGGLAGLAVFFLPIDEHEITLWLRDETEIEIPTAPSGSDLILSFKGEPISRATLVRAQLLNSGQTPIGDVDEEWDISFSSEDDSNIVIPPDFDPHPSIMSVRLVIPPTSAFPTLRIGLFNPNDYVDIWIILIDSPVTGDVNLQAETRVPNISAAVVTRQSLESRFTDAYKGPVRVLSWLLALGIATVFLYMRRHDIRNKLSNNNRKGARIEIAATILATVVVSPLLPIVLDPLVVRVVMLAYSK